MRIPCVQKAFEDYLKRPMSKTCDGDESVARGAAWQVRTFTSLLLARWTLIRSLWWRAEQAALLSPRYTIQAAPQLKDLYPYGISVVCISVSR